MVSEVKILVGDELRKCACTPFFLMGTFSYGNTSPGPEPVGLPRVSPEAGDPRWGVEEEEAVTVTRQSRRRGWE